MRRRRNSCEHNKVQYFSYIYYEHVAFKKKFISNVVIFFFNYICEHKKGKKKLNVMCNVLIIFVEKLTIFYIQKSNIKLNKLKSI